MEVYKAKMKESSRGELLETILAVVEKHPNTKVSKLIKRVESEKTQKNIILLLIELAEHPELSSNTLISLKYYLDMFEDLTEEPSFAEAGLLLLNSAIIYGKRVDSIHLNIERLILSLINTENVEEKTHDPNSTPKIIRRGRKRSLDQLCGPYEADMSAKRFKIISRTKRFEDFSPKSTKKCSYASIEKEKESLSKEYKHPTIWRYSVIEDYDYDDEIDSKRNYKLFTYHLEHRYNTLIPDINFKMYFKIKDFIDSECRDSSQSELWPPLSEAYIEHFVNLENHILHIDGHDAKNQYNAEERTRCNTEQNEMKAQDALLHIPSLLRVPQIPEDNPLELVTRSSCLDSQICLSNSIVLNEISYQDQPVHQADVVIAEPGIGLSSHDSSLAVSIMTNEHQVARKAESDIDSEKIHENTLIKTSIIIGNSEKSFLSGEQIDSNNAVNNSAVKSDASMESQTKTNIAEFNSSNNHIMPNGCISKTNHDPTLLNSKHENEDLTTIKVLLPHLDDEGVFFSDLDERDQQMLSPAVVATDVFRCVKDKSNIIVIVDDVIKRIYNIQEPRQQVLSLPVFSCPEYPSLPLNILKIHHKYFKKRRTFKLGSEFHLLKKEHHKKYGRETKFLRERVRLCEDVTSVPLSPLSSPNYEPEFYGFPEEVTNDKNRTLSRDSGISLHQIENTSDRETNDDFNESKHLFHSTLQSAHTSGIQEIHDTSITSVETQPNKFLETSTGSGQLEDSEEAFFNENVSKQTENNYCYEVIASEDKDLSECMESSLGITINKNLTSVMSKVQEWHAHLQPILAQSRDRHHFDVFELGSEIMSQFDRCKISNKILSLNQVMENKDSSLVSRYFLSALLLANQGNVSINIKSRSSEVPSELNDVEMRLLTKKRNIVCLEDNVCFRTPQMSIERPIKETALTNIRTLKPVPTALQTEDHDSGISLSDACSI